MTAGDDGIAEAVEAYRNHLRTLAESTPDHMQKAIAAEDVADQLTAILNRETGSNRQTEGE